jgi:hypothetical protein
MSWDPYVELALIFVVKNLGQPRTRRSSLETIEAGWVKRAGGGPSRLFVYMTNNSYGAAGPGINLTVLFNSDGLRDHADNATWGGETFDESGSTHTATDMGSVRFPCRPIVATSAMPLISGL